MDSFRPVQRAYFQDFLNRATPEQVRDLLVLIQDYLISPSNYLDEMPMADLEDIIGTIDDAIYDYDNSEEREAENKAAHEEFKADCRREEKWNK